MTMPAAPAPTFAPSTPDMSTVAIVATIVRQVLMLASGLGFGWAIHILGTSTADATITLIASAGIGVAVILVLLVIAPKDDYEK